MLDLISLSCPSCNGKLQINSTIDRFACGYCGTEFMVNRGGGVISLAPVVEGLKRVEAGVDKTASELAIARLRQEIQSLTQQRDSITTDSTLIYFAFALVLLFFGLASFSNNWVFGLMLIFLSIGVAVAGLHSANRKNQMRASVDDTIVAKRAELAHHEEVVRR
jgi:hypothetical protein